jgi:ABC-2 type transport system permease protein
LEALFLLGYAIDTNVRHVRTVILDQAGTQESRQLLEKFENSEDFTIVARVFSDAELSRTIVAGKVRVGIKIPSDYSERLQAGQTAQILVLVDGSESSVAAEAVNVGNAIALRRFCEAPRPMRENLLIDACPALGGWLPCRPRRS